MRIILTILSIVISFGSIAQSPEDDEVTFRTAVDWLNSKLEYVYYDKDSQKWWTNTFYVNESKEVTIKQISAKNPKSANLKEKTYTIRKFRIQDINPYTIQIKDVKEATGRFAKGKLLEIHTFDGEAKIHKQINNIKATSTSFLHLSFPESLTDTLANYPELVKEKLYDAVVAATKIYPVDLEGNKTLIMETLKGEYASENGEQWVTEELYPGILEIHSEEKERFFGFDKQKNEFFLTEISPEGTVTHFLKVSHGVKLIIEAEDDPDFHIEFETFNSFRLNGVWYYRQ